MIQELLDELSAAVGSALSTVEADLALTTTDKSGHISIGLPLAVVNAGSIQDVQATMRIASKYEVPVVTRGAGTGLAGGAIASAGEIVLSTLAMDRLIEVSAADEYAVVEPGMINGDLGEALRPYGLWFAPDPASRAISTIGGNIATNAGGLLCAKYGVTRDAVLGLKVVLADGRLLSVGRRTVKGVTGFDLTALFVGSEGTLGVIVEATLKLRRIVGGVVATIGAYFPDVATAAAASSSITAAGIRPAVMELLDAEALRAIGAFLGQDLAPRRPDAAYLVVQTDGPASTTEAEAAIAIIRSGGGEAQLSTDPAEGERLLSIRRAFHPALEAQGTVLIEDVSVPRSALAEMFRAIDRISRSHNISIPTVAHAGDGNLHPNFIYRSEDGTVPPAVWAAADELFRESLRLGGTLTGEHGVGILKKRWLREELGDDQYELQRQLKAVFDPKSILNPGKVFSDPAPANSTCHDTDDRLPK